MAFNVRSGGLAVSVPVDETVKSGDVVRVGELTGVAEIDATVGDDGLFYSTVAIEGIGSGESVDAFEVGDVVGTDEVTDGVAADIVNGGAKAVGIATRAKAAGAGRVWFKLVPNVTVEP